MLLEQERYYGVGMDALIIVCSWNTNGIMLWAWMLRSSYAPGTRVESWFGHGCSDHRMLLEHERNHGLVMDALVIVCSWNRNVIMVWAWMLAKFAKSALLPQCQHHFLKKTRTSQGCWPLQTLREAITCAYEPACYLAFDILYIYIHARSRIRFMCVSTHNNLVMFYMYTLV